jgi:anti-anti-sigma factor
VGEIAGSIDANTLPEFLGHIRAFQEKARKFILLKSDGLKYVNSSGLGTLIKVAGEYQQEGGQFAMTGVPPKIRSLFKMLNMLDVVKIYETEEEGLRAFEGRKEPEPAPTAPAREFPILIRCISCRRKIELPAVGYFRCPRCGACFSVEMRMACSPDLLPALHAAAEGLVRQKEIPSAEWAVLRNVLERASTAAWSGATGNETCSVYLVADRREFRAAIKVDRNAFDSHGPLQEVRPQVDEMDIVTLPGGGQVLKFSRKIRRPS